MKTMAMILSISESTSYTMQNPFESPPPEQAIQSRRQCRTLRKFLGKVNTVCSSFVRSVMLTDVRTYSVYKKDFETCRDEHYRSSTWLSQSS